jgi:hypothetical protein
LNFGIQIFSLSRKIVKKIRIPILRIRLTTSRKPPPDSWAGGKIRFFFFFSLYLAKPHLPARAIKRNGTVTQNQRSVPYYGMEKSSGEGNMQKGDESRKTYNIRRTLVSSHANTVSVMQVKVT